MTESDSEEELEEFEKIPLYLFDENETANKLEELSCDEYLYWLKQIPKKYKHKYINKLFKEAATNGAIKTTKYLIKISNKTISFDIYKEMINKSIEASQVKYLRWLLNEIIPNNFFEKYNNFWSWSDCMHNYVVKNNFEIFLELESKIKMDYEHTIHWAILFSRHEFINYIIDNKKYDYNKLLETLRNVEFKNVKIFLKLYEIVKEDLTEYDLKNILYHCESIGVLRFFEQFKFFKAINIKEMLISKISRTVHNKTEYARDLSKNIFDYLFFKFKDVWSIQDLTDIFQVVNGRCHYILKKYFAERLIDAGVVVDNYKEEYYDYYLIKKRINNKLKYNYNFDNFDENNNFFI